MTFSNIRHHPENQTVPGLLMVRPENGLFFANAAGIREAMIHQVESSAAPVKEVLIHLSATSDLDAPGADMLIELHKELRNRNLRFMLTRVITPVRLMLERAGVMKEISPEDIFIEPTDAVLDYFISEYDDSRIQELLHSGLVMVHDIVSARLPTAPPERQVALTALAERLDQEIKQIET